MPKIKKGTWETFNREQEGNIDSKQGSGNTKYQHFFLEQWRNICNFNKGTGEHDQWRSRRWLLLGRTTKGPMDMGPPTEKRNGKGPRTSHFTKGPTHLSYATEHDPPYSLMVTLAKVIIFTLDLDLFRLLKALYLIWWALYWQYLICIVWL